MESGMDMLPDELLSFAYVPAFDDRLDELSRLAEDEPGDWDFNATPTGRKPILRNYIFRTYSRLAFEDKVQINDDGELAAFNTGLVTESQEQICAIFERNRNLDKQDWYFRAWAREGEHYLNGFRGTPKIAHYFDNPSMLVFDTRKELRVHYDHIVNENLSRFPTEFRTLGLHNLSALLRGKIDQAKIRVIRNYKAAIPQYYNNKVQLLLPICLTNPSIADLALVVDDVGHDYRASTCLTLEMAYSNARQITRPDRDWLRP
ncbi:DUF3825 domain-containing protein [uncultured Sphingomonas sp.]|uniref:DUF3825 domain-containing protein n=1 Tax=uncultured Sphingomonas sp. TaxID=158754 RepID=UPI0035CB8A2F